MKRKEWTKKHGGDTYDESGCGKIEKIKAKITKKLSSTKHSITNKSVVHVQDMPDSDDGCFDFESDDFESDDDFYMLMSSNVLVIQMVKVIKTFVL